MGITPIDPKNPTTETAFAGTKLVKDSHHYYKYRATGRVNTIGLGAKLEVRKILGNFQKYKKIQKFRKNQRIFLEFFGFFLIFFCSLERDKKCFLIWLWNH